MPEGKGCDICGSCSDIMSNRALKTCSSCYAVVCPIHSYVVADELFCTECINESDFLGLSTSGAERS